MYTCVYKYSHNNVQTKLCSNVAPVSNSCYLGLVHNYILLCRTTMVMVLLLHPWIEENKNDNYLIIWTEQSCKAVVICSKILIKRYV